MLHRNLLKNSLNCQKVFSSSVQLQKYHSKFVIAGGGAGGITMAARILKHLGEKDVTVIEPSEVHYYQPYWTLVGGRKKRLEDSLRPMSSVIPKNVNWIKDKVIGFSPEENAVKTENSGNIQYDYLIIALGLQLAFNKIKGLPDAFNTAGVCSNYSANTVTKTSEALEKFKKGNAIFTQPINPIKCAGAPQKIMYLSEEYFRKGGKIEKANIIFNTALDTIFSAPKYAAALREVAKSKNITVNYLHSLSEVRPITKEAIFDILDKKGSVIDKKIFEYEMLHITPPMIAPSVLSKSNLSDAAGWLDVNKHTLQSTKFSNIFGLGDCTNVPTSKTAAAVECLPRQLAAVCISKVAQHAIKRIQYSFVAPVSLAKIQLQLSAMWNQCTLLIPVCYWRESGRNVLAAAQCNILTKNLKLVLQGKSTFHIYNGYSSCPLVTGYNKGILAEFDFELKAVETLPINQAKERYLSFYLKKNVMPILYWNMMLKGRWPGPSMLRKFLHLGFV